MTTMKKAATVDLKSYMERIERLEEERKELGDDIRSVYAEAKSAGFDTKALRSLIKLRKKDAGERAEEEAILDTYMHAVGMATETPLFAAVGAMGTDTAAREQVVEAFKLLVPATGEIVVKMGGNPIRLWRDDKGKAHAEDFVEPATAPLEKTGKALKKPATVLTMVPKGTAPPDDEKAPAVEKEPAPA
jgi:uncharacterized protein (UPF0335 family)